MSKIVDVVGTEHTTTARALAGVDVLHVPGQAFRVLTGPPVCGGPALHCLTIDPDAGVVQREQGAYDRVLLEACRDGVVVVDRKRETPHRLDGVELGRRTYSPVLRQADLPEVSVPWLGGRTMRYEFA
jgi:hypothetical protein